MAEGTDVTLADIARLTDVFYIGGTKWVPCAARPWCSPTVPRPTS